MRLIFTCNSPKNNPALATGRLPNKGRKNIKINLAA